jgi:hypothetical protein
MEYEVYRHQDAPEAEFTELSDFFKQVLREDKDLCNAAQKNLNAGIFTNGQLHPNAEKVSYYRDSDIEYLELNTKRDLYTSRS